MNNLKSSGAQSLSGGEYEKVRISGSLNLSGDLKCTDLHVSGSTHSSASIGCSGCGHFSGSVNCDGDLLIRDLHCSGSIHARNVICTEACVSGSLRCHGRLEGEFVRVSGSVDAEKVDAKQMEVCGNLFCRGPVNVDDLALNLHFSASGSAAGVKGKKIQIAGDWSKSFFNLTSKFETPLMEADDIRIDYVTCDTVRGKTVVIGSHCSIQHVEYTDSCKICKGAKVGESIQK